MFAKDLQRRKKGWGTGWHHVPIFVCFLNQLTCINYFVAPTSPFSTPFGFRIEQLIFNNIMPTSKNCSAPNCPNTGDQNCSGCADASYCSRECQRNDWRFHKETCYSSHKCNCFVLRAKGPENVSPTNVMAHVRA